LRVTMSVDASGPLQAKVLDTCRNTLRVTMSVDASGPLQAKGLPEVECTETKMNAPSPSQ